MSDEVVQTPFGSFLVNPDECIGGTVKAGTVWDGPGFLQVIAREYGRLGEDQVTILDVGAHLGDWAIWLAGQGAWRVIAVEPAPEMIRYLKANLDLNKPTCAETVVVLPVAAYDRKTDLIWTVPYEPRDSGGAALRRLQDHEVPDRPIPAAPLDDYQYLYGDHVSLIKIDAQGCDGAAIAGLGDTIHKHHPAIVFEWEEELSHAHPYPFAEVCRFLTGADYEIHEWPSHLHNFLARPRR